MDQPNYVVPDRPVGDSSNASANTRFVALAKGYVDPDAFKLITDTSDTPCLQAAINFGKANFLPVRLSRKYTVKEAAGALGYCLLIDNSVILEGTAPSSTTNFPNGLNQPMGWIFPDSTVGAGVDIIKIRGAGQSLLNHLQLLSFTIGDPNNLRGNRGIYIETPANTEFGFAKFERLTIYPTNSPRSIYQFNDGTGAIGGMYLSQIVDCDIVGAIRLEVTGTKNIIRHNEISGNDSGVGVYYSMIGPAVGGTIEENNIADNGGAIKLDSTDGVQIIRNNIEISASANGSNGALIDLNGAGGGCFSCEIEGNFIGNASSSGTLLNGIRIATADNTHVGWNDWSASASQISTGHWVTITAAATNTKIEAIQGGDWATDFASSGSWIADLGAGTKYTLNLSATKFVTAAKAGPQTLVAGDITGADFVFLENTGAVPGTQTFRTAAQMLADIPGAIPGQSFNFRIVNTGAGTLTLAGGGGTGVTTTGTMATLTNTFRDYILTFNTATTATVQSVGSGVSP